MRFLGTYKISIEDNKNKARFRYDFHQLMYVSYPSTLCSSMFLVILNHDGSFLFPRGGTDFVNIFAEKFSKKIGVFDSIMQNFDHT
jgi:hypothetical protein